MSVGNGTPEFMRQQQKDDAGITVQIGPNPETLDPALNNAVDGGNMLITLYETLLIIDEDNKVQPGQAEKYTVSEDGLTWTFTMRDGLKWSDGTELNAKDFEYTFKRLTNTELAAPMPRLLSVWLRAIRTLSAIRIKTVSPLLLPIPTSSTL